MMASINAKQIRLLNILNKLFLVDTDVRIHPDLTEDLLQKLVEDTRTIIIELYLKCEDDYLEGMKIYEAIVETQIIQTSQNQIQTLEKGMEKLINF